MSEVIGKESLTDKIKEIMAACDVKITKQQIGSVLTILTDVMSGELAKGNKIQLIGFGSFFLRERAARKGKNISTGENFTIRAMNTVAFHPAKALKDMMN